MSLHDFDKPGVAPSAHATDHGGLERVESFRVVKFLGEGGMGRVYLAQHAVLDRRCALKFMPDDLVKKPGWVERFKTEARTLAKLNHSNIVGVYGAVADTASGKYFLEMEYVDGGDLESRIDSSRTGLPEEEARRVLDEILQALAYAHSQNVIHRDLKPANILLRKDGHVKISDFGLATVVGEEYHRSLIQKSITLSQMISTGDTVQASQSMMSAVGGTLPYMSPQAKKGESADLRDDIYAVGVMVYNMLTGDLPEIDAASLRKLRPELDKRWDRFFRKCIASRREDRFQDATEARAVLARFGRKPRRGLVWSAAAGLSLAAAVGAWYGFAPVRALISGLTPSSPAHAQTITLAPLPREIAQEQALQLSATASSGLPVSFAVTSGPARIEKGLLLFSGPGRVVVLASQDGDSRFSPAPAIERELIVLNRPVVTHPQTISFPPLMDRDTSITSVDVSATTSSGLPVALTVVSGPATLTNNNRLALTGPGTVIVRAAQAGNAFFAAADPVERSFVVARHITPEIVIALPGGAALTCKLVPAGEVQLGAVSGELGWTRNDSRVETFKNVTPYYIAATEITQRQYEAVMGKGKNPSHNRFGGREDFPVEQVLYGDLAGRGGFIEMFNGLLREQGLQEYRAALPTEQEWEYACRAGETSALNDGSPLSSLSRDPALDRLGIYNAMATAAAGSRQPNKWGIYDMHGNVAEWTEEGHLRGGAFRDSAASCRASARLRDQRTKTAPDNRFGFRIVLKRAAE